MGYVADSLRARTPAAEPYYGLHARWPSGEREILAPAIVKQLAAAIGIVLAGALAATGLRGGYLLVAVGLGVLGAWKAMAWIVPMGHELCVPVEDLRGPTWITLDRSDRSWTVTAVMKVFVDYSYAVPNHNLALSNGKSVTLKKGEEVAVVEIEDRHARSRVPAPHESSMERDLSDVYAALDAIWLLTPPRNGQGVCEARESEVGARLVGEGMVASQGIGRANRWRLIRRIERKKVEPVLEMTAAGTMWYAQASREMGREVILGAADDKVSRAEKSINIGAGAIILAPVVIADAMERSFNSVGEASAFDDALITLVKQLGEAVVAVSRAAPEGGPDLAADFEGFAKEVARDEPRKRRYGFALESLKETATVLGTVGVPVVDLVSKVARLLDL